MPIKKSSLERKWYYRLAKVFFLILPLLILLLLLLGKKTLACTVVPGNFFGLSPNAFVFIAIGLVLYYVLLKWLWVALLYIAFGGIKDDTRGENGTKNGDAQPAAPAKLERAKAMQMTRLIIMLILLTVGFLAAMGYITLPKIDFNALPQTGQDFVNPPNARSTLFCPYLSSQMATPCGSVNNGVGVSGVIVYDACDCPSDTTYSGTTDVVTPGGPYKICTCN